MISYLICLAILLAIYAFMFRAKKSFEKSQIKEDSIDINGGHWNNGYYGGHSLSSEDSYSSSDCGSDFGGGDCGSGD